MNTAQTRIHNNACFVTVTIDGHSLHAKFVPSKQAIIRLEADDMPASMMKQEGDPSPAAVEVADKAVAVEQHQEQPNLGVAATIAGAAKLAATHLGIGMASKDDVSRRTSVCLGCPKNDLGRCNACGCYLWAKVRQAKETCPIGKW